MKRACVSIGLLLSVLMVSSNGQAQDDIAAPASIPDGPYLGQKPPGNIAEVFAPGIVSTTQWGDAGRFSIDMNEFHVLRWRLNGGKGETQSVMFENRNGQWHAVSVPDRDRLPFFSPDGGMMYLGKSYQERTETGWSEAKSLGPAFEDIRIMSVSASRNGTLVFDEAARDGNGVLRYSQLVDGKREDPRPLDKAINTGIWNGHPFIAPDESYIIWDGERESGYGEADLYISFREEDGSWGDAINLGDSVNTQAEERGAQVTPDGKYLFFNRVMPPATGDGQPQSDLYWIDAQIIEALRPKS